MTGQRMRVGRCSLAQWILQGHTSTTPTKHHSQGWVALFVVVIVVLCNISFQLSGKILQISSQTCGIIYTTYFSMPSATSSAKPWLHYNRWSTLTNVSSAPTVLSFSSERRSHVRFGAWHGEDFWREPRGMSVACSNSCWCRPRATHPSGACLLRGGALVSWIETAHSKSRLIHKNIREKDLQQIGG